jgi:hypothetical protein
MYVVNHLAFITGKPPRPAYLFTDSSTITDQVNWYALKLPKDKSTCVSLHWFQQEIKEKNITVQWVPSGLNLADALTKPTNMKLLQAMLSDVSQEA